MKTATRFATPATAETFLTGNDEARGLCLTQLLGRGFDYQPRKTQERATAHEIGQVLGKSDLLGIRQALDVLGIGQLGIMSPSLAIEHLWLAGEDDLWNLIKGGQLRVITLRRKRFFSADAVLHLAGTIRALMPLCTECHKIHFGTNSCSGQNGRRRH